MLSAFEGGDRLSGLSVTCPDTTPGGATEAGDVAGAVAGAVDDGAVFASAVAGADEELGASDTLTEGLEGVEEGLTEDEGDAPTLGDTLAGADDGAGFDPPPLGALADETAGFVPPPKPFCTNGEPACEAAVVGDAADDDVAADVGNIGLGIALPFGVKGLAPGLIGIVDCVGLTQDGI